MKSFRSLSKKEQLFLLVTGLLTLALMVFIFLMSQKSATNSASQSGRFVKLIISLFIRNFDSLSEEKQLAIRETLSFFVRKGAHFSEFLLLGFLLYTHLNRFPQRKWLSLPVGILYGVSDEVHQLFIPGRSCEIRDMCIDGAGVLTGVLIAFLLFLLIRKIQKSSKKRNK